MPRDRRTPTPEQLDAARNKRLPDVLSPSIQVLFVGINPSLYSAAVGHHFARPGNRFWPALHGAGWTDRLLAPAEDARLPEFGAGLTNIATRPTARADELQTDELRRGRRRLERIVTRYRPRHVAILGVTAFRQAFNEPGARIELGRRRLWTARLWLLPNPSGLNAHYRLPDFVELFGQLRTAAAVEPRPCSTASGAGSPEE